jgi:alpha-L-arabinofuranosidase
MINRQKIIIQNVLKLMSRAMKTVDPSVEIIIDGTNEIGNDALKRFGELISYVTFHQYTPWSVREIIRGDTIVPPELVSEREVWQAVATAPFIDSLSGHSVINHWVLDNVRPPLAMTEWNLACFFHQDFNQVITFNRLLSFGIGAGSFLHAIMRASDKVKIANQSLLVGIGWPMTSIRLDTTEQKRPAMFPTGLVTGLYSREHGNQLMEVLISNANYYVQPIKLSRISPVQKVVEQDVLVTSDESDFYIHIVNRSFDQDRDIIIQFPEKIQKNYTHYLISDRTNGTFSEVANVEVIYLDGASKKTLLSVPERSVSVFKFSR